MFQYHFDFPDTDSDTWAFGIGQCRVPIQYQCKKTKQKKGFFLF